MVKTEPPPKVVKVIKFPNKFVGLYVTKVRATVKVQ